MIYAELDDKNIVKQVILASAEHIATRPGVWVKVCPEGKNPRTYPGIGFTYVPYLNAFLRPKPGVYWKRDAAGINWIPTKTQPVVQGEPVPGFYEELLKDNNGKQLYETIIEGPNKLDIIKVPVKIQGILLDVRKQ